MKLVIMKEIIDNIDRRILYELDWNARISETELAKRINRSRETVRYRIKQLEKKGIILSYATWINVAKLGYHAYKMYLKIGGTEEERQEFFDDMKQRPDLFWLGIGDGAWDVGLTFFAKSHQEFYDMKNQLFPKYNRIILQKFTGVVVEASFYPETIFYEKQLEKRTIFGSVNRNEIDDIDKRILSILYLNARIKLVDLAARAGVSVDIARHRIKRLEENKIISTYKTVINFQKIGMDFYKAFLYFDSFSKQEQKKLFEIAKQDPHIPRMVFLISPWDVELEIRAYNHQEFNKVIRKIKTEFPKLRNVESTAMSGDFVFPAKGTIMKL